MNFIITRIASLRRDSKGQDLVEYALLVALVVIAALTTVSSVATVIKRNFWDVAAALF